LTATQRRQSGDELFLLQSSGGAQVDARVPATGAVVLALGVVTFFIDPTRFTWPRRQESFWDRVGEAWRLLGTLFYWALGTATVSSLAYLIRLGWEAWRGA
jgi:hypothetical protein